MIIYQCLAALFWLIVAPFLVGLILPGKKGEGAQDAGFHLLAGYLILFSIFWCITVPAVIFVKYDSFLVVVWVYTILVLLLAVTGFLLYLRRQKKGEESIRIPFLCMKNSSLYEKAGMVIFLLLVAFQMFQAMRLSSFDGDDAYFVAQSLITQQSNTMYLILPYTGGTTSIDLRHALAVFPMWIAYIARMTNIHATIVSHTVLPLILIPLTYLIYFEIGRKLFAARKRLLPPFMILLSIFQIFGNVSIYTNETFFLTRTWQGKSLTANFVFPAIIWILLWISKEKKKGFGAEKELWILLALVNMTAGICSSMAVFLGGMLVAIVAFWMAVLEKRFSILVKAGLACIPNAAYMLLYLLLR